MSVTKLAVRHRGQNIQSICRECSSIWRKKARAKIWFSVRHSIMRKICSPLLWVRMIANCNILTVSQGRLKLRHIGINDISSTLPIQRSRRKIARGFTSILFSKQITGSQKKNQDRLKEESFRIQWPEQVEFILNSCSVCFRRKPLEVQVQDTSGPNPAFLWKSAIRCSINICNCVLCCWFKSWGVKFWLGEEDMMT